MTNLGHLTLLFLPLGCTKQSQLWHQSLGANPAGASPSSERRRILHNTDTASYHQSARQSAATGGDLEVLVSWIVAWRNESSSSVYHCLLLCSQHQTILR